MEIRLSCTACSTSVNLHTISKGCRITEKLIFVSMILWRLIPASFTSPHFAAADCAQDRLVTDTDIMHAWENQNPAANMCTRY